MINKYTELNEYIGIELKYKEITKICDLKYYSGGNSKKTQIDDIERYYVLEKHKSKYLITEIRDIPLDKEDGRKTAPVGNRVNNGSNKYNEELIPLLHDYITKVKQYDAIAKKYLVKINLLDGDYLELKNPKVVDRIRNKSDINVTQNTLEDFHNFIFPTMNKSMRSALSRLHKDGKIEYREFMYVLEYDEKVPHEATKEELEIIAENETFVLNELFEKGIISKPDKRAVRSKKAKVKYEKLLDDCLAEDGIKMCWKSIYTKIIEPFTLEDDQRSTMISTLRNKFAKEAGTQADKYKFKDYKKIDFTWGEYSEIDYIKPYDFDFSPYGYTRMQEVIKYFLMTDSNPKQRYIDNCIDDGTKELIEIGLCREKDLFVAKIK